MKKRRLHAKPAKHGVYAFEEFYNEISHDWQHKAEELQIRRWRMLKHAEKSSYY